MEKLFLLLIILFVSSCGSLSEENAEIEPQDILAEIEEPLLVSHVINNYEPEK